MSVATILFVGGIMKFESERHLTRIVHRELGQVSRQAADRVTKFMFERANDAELLAKAMGRMTNPASRAKALRELTRLYPESIAWAGAVDTDCNVAFASDDRYVGWTVAAGQCRSALQAPTMSKAHRDERLQTEPEGPNDPMTFITISHPISDEQNQVIGFVALELKTFYLDAIQNAVSIQIAEGHPTEAFIVSKNGHRVLVGGAKHGMIVDQSFIDGLIDQNAQVNVAWPDGNQFITGAAETAVFRNLPNLNWIVVTRALREDALMVSGDLSRRIAFWGVGALALAILLGLFLAHRLGHPLRALTHSAENEATLRVGETGRYREIDELNHALVTRFNDLQEANERTREALIDRSNALVDREALLKEVHHRVKNNLQVIISLMRLQGSRVRQNPSGKAVIERLTSRVQVLGWLYSKLYEKAIFEDVDSRDIIAPLIQQIQDTYPSDVTIESQIDTVSLGFDQTLVLGMLAIEVVTNAVQHAYEDEGEVHVTLLHMGDGGYEFTVSDRGGGFDATQRYSGIGLTLSQRMAGQLGGDLRVESTEDGTCVRVQFSIVVSESSLPGPETVAA